jgi:arsenate reductase-like glutaredoxin family protein
MHAEVDSRDFFQDRFSDGELRTLLGDRPANNFFSWASPSFKKLGLDRNSIEEDQLIALMLNEPRLLRRPLIVVNGELLPSISGSRKIIETLEKILGT